ncbi:BgTH12-07067 [Blumeria graminis f. sp. triticale]|uniref:BgTH12-07067 n=1 Tax=Blumeria graminis f. sp. triticale TaxID=1689686 RepID=A0A9W4GI03_BLUGR|nr:BgTH12-07067 [Blumeria graminis f. sp. triticale]
MTEGNMTLKYWLDDLCVRFLMNGPKEDLETAERICFRVEEAQWYYEDFIRPLDPTLPSMTLKGFCEEIFAHCPLLLPFSQDHRMKAFDAFLSYKKRIPVRGAIMLNHDMDRVVLVKGWKKNANWSFPRGKINKDEDDLDCAVREVYEETGFDIEEAGLIPENRQVKSIDLNMHEQQIRLFVFRDIPLDTHFEPRTRKEISAIDWWQLSDLPAFRKGKASTHQQPEIKSTNFYMVAPFLTHLRKWIIDQKKQSSRRRTFNSSRSLNGVTVHDETLTEEEQGTESNPDANYSKNGISENQMNTIYSQDIRDRESHHFHSFQSTQQDSEQFQKQPSDSIGPALLALLHNKPNIDPQSVHLLSETRLNQDLIPPIVPSPKNFESSRPLVADFTTNKNEAEYQINHLQSHIKSQYERMIEAQKHIQAYQKQNNFSGSHPYQSQHLIHPQPLPPHVQRALFAQSPLQSPLIPKAAPNVGSALAQHNQYFPSIASTIQDQEKCVAIPSTSWLDSPLHTNHDDLNYSQQLNTDTARRHLETQPQASASVTQAAWPGVATKDSNNYRKTWNNQSISQYENTLSWNSYQNELLTPLPTFEDKNQPSHGKHFQNTEESCTLMQNPLSHKQHQFNRKHDIHRQSDQQIYPQTHVPRLSHELSASSCLIPQALNLTSISSKMNGNQIPSPDIYSPRYPPTENQKSALLGLFKGSDTYNFQSSIQNDIKTLPTPPTLSAVELSAVEPLSSKAEKKSVTQNSNRDRKKISLNETTTEISPTSQAVNIQLRPSEFAEKSMLPLQIAPSKTSFKLAQTEKFRGKQVKPPDKSTALFRPRILKRHQTEPDASGIEFESSTSNSSSKELGEYGHKQSQSTDHKQDLLSLFGKQAPGFRQSSADNFPPSPIPDYDVTYQYQEKSLELKPKILQKKTPKISSADKGFLLSYLDDIVAKGTSF